MISTDQPGAVFDVPAAVLIVAAVPYPADETFQIVAVGAVNLDAVEARRVSAFRRREVQALVFLDFLQGKPAHRFAHRRRAGNFIRAEIGGADGQAAAVAGHGRGSRMVKLAHDRAAVGVAALHDARDAGQEPVVPQCAVQSGGVVAAPGDGGEDGKPHAAPGESLVEADHAISGGAVFLKEP